MEINIKNIQWQENRILPLSRNIGMVIDMMIKSKEELRNVLKERALNALLKTQAQVYEIINRFVKEYYAEYSPTFYERTYQLYRSLVTSKIQPTKNGYKCSVYFDINRLDYYMKMVKGKQRRNKGWSAAKTLKTAMTSKHPHGGYRKIGGTAIWIEAMRVIDKNGIEILKKMLKDSGIPLKE